jgi:diketogulonate reductase-like aldo/keto reductase
MRRPRHNVEFDLHLSRGFNMGIRTTALPSGELVPVLGQGTWHFAEDPRRRPDEIAALRAGLDLGISLIDTAEMYADGAAEELVADAIGGHRDQVFLVSKVLPNHASRRGTAAACEESLKRLRTDRLDLCLLHWRGSVPLQDTIEAFEELAGAGKIRYWGVSNFGAEDMEELIRLSRGTNCAANQVVYNLTRRGIEWDLLPWCKERRIPVMAYSPIEQGELLEHAGLKRMAERHRASPVQVALAWVLRQEGVIAIPRAGKPSHVRENYRALSLSLAAKDLEDLDRLFPPPDRKKRLEII